MPEGDETRIPQEDNSLWSEIYKQLRNAQKDHEDLDPDSIAALQKMQQSFISESTVEKKSAALQEFFYPQASGIIDTAINTAISFLSFPIIQGASKLLLGTNLGADLGAAIGLAAPQELAEHKSQQRIHKYKDLFQQAQILNNNHTTVNNLQQDLVAPETIFSDLCALQTTTLQTTKIKPSSNGESGAIFGEIICKRNKATNDEPHKHNAKLILLSIVAMFKDKSDLLENINKFLNKNYLNLQSCLEDLTCHQLLILEDASNASMQPFIEKIKAAHLAILGKNIPAIDRAPRYSSTGDKIISDAKEAVTIEAQNIINRTSPTIWSSISENVINLAISSTPAIAREILNTFTSLFNSNTRESNPTPQIIHAALLTGSDLTKVFKQFDTNDNTQLSVAISTFMHLSGQYTELENKDLMQIIQLYNTNPHRYEFLPELIKKIIPIHISNNEILNLTTNTHEIPDNTLQEILEKFAKNQAFLALLLKHKLPTQETNLDFIKNYINACASPPSEQEMAFLLKLQNPENFNKFTQAALAKEATLNPEVKTRFLPKIDDHTTFHIKTLLKKLTTDNQLTSASECYEYAFQQEWATKVQTLLVEIQPFKILETNNSAGKKLGRLRAFYDTIDHQNLENANFMQLMCLYYMVKEGYTTTTNKDDLKNYLTKLQEIIACFNIQDYYISTKYTDPQEQEQELYDLAKYCFENNKFTELKEKNTDELFKMKNSDNSFIRGMKEILGYVKIAVTFLVIMFLPKTAVDTVSKLYGKASDFWSTVKYFIYPSADDTSAKCSYEPSRDFSTNCVLTQLEDNSLGPHVQRNFDILGKCYDREKHTQATMEKAVAVRTNNNGQNNHPAATDSRGNLQQNDAHLASEDRSNNGLSM